MALIAESRCSRDLRNRASCCLEETARFFDTQRTLEVSESDADVFSEGAPEMCRLNTCEGRELRQ